MATWIYLAHNVLHAKVGVNFEEDKIRHYETVKSGPSRERKRRKVCNTTKDMALRYAAYGITTDGLEQTLRWGINEGYAQTTLL